MKFGYKLSKLTKLKNPNLKAKIATASKFLEKVATCFHIKSLTFSLFKL